MDWQGQKLAEEILQWGLIAAAIVAFLTGYFVGSFQLMLIIYAGLLLVVSLIVVPDWGFFNRHPLQWLDPKLAESSPKASQENKKTSSRASKK